MVLYFTCKREHSINWISSLKRGWWCCEGDSSFPSSHFTPFLCLRSHGGGHSHCWGCWSCSQPFWPPPPHCPLPGTKSPLYSQHQRLSCSITPQSSPFYSQGRVALAGKSPPEAAESLSLLCVTSKEWIHGIAHQSRFWDLIGGGETFKRGDFAHTSFYLLKTWSDAEEVSQGLLRAGSRLGRAASHQVRRGAGRCSRWPR